MRCPRCGAALAVGAAVCGNCGEAVASWSTAGASTETVRSPAGLPITRYAPSPYGPPVDGDRQMTPVALAEANVEPRRAFGYRPVELPPPLPRRSSGGKRLALVCLAAVAALLLAAALTHGGKSLGAGEHSPASTPAVAGARATATPACQARTINPAAAKLVSQLQLTTGVRDAAKKDYRPVDKVTTFASHQAVYLTFEISTSKAGSVNAIFCAPGLQALGRIAIPANSGGRYAEFAIVPGDANAGQAMVTLLWNGAVAANLPFTITQ